MRDSRIDILRAIGLAAIIFAHSGPPGFLFQLRNFDVPLMVIASAMSFGLSYSSGYPYLSYVWKRIKRLVFPVWLFLTAYFIAQIAILPTSAELNLKTILGSYALIEGIGYVWVIRVFLLVALASPLLWAFNKKTLKNSRFFGLVAIAFIFYELLRHYSLPYIQDDFEKLVSLILIQPIPYFLTFLIGLRMRVMRKPQLYAMSACSLAVFIIMGTGLFMQADGLVPTQALKYPPSAYYIAYALFISTLLWIFSHQIENLFEWMRIKGAVLFVASNSMWIYLWHIPFVKIIHTNFLVKTLIVFSVAIVIACFQNWVVSNLVLSHLRDDKIRKNIKALLIG